MGYDCTLHAIDEAALTQVASDLIAKKKKGHFAKVRALLDAKDPDAGLAVTEFAMLEASSSGPHLSTRGVALSLWDEKLLGPTPWKLFGSPLTRLAKEWPHLKGRIPTSFESNYCTGVFVSAKEVPKLLVEVERRFAARQKGDTHDWLPVLKILRIAARHRHAYWEATDLRVREGHREWLKEEQPKAETKLQKHRASFGFLPQLLAANGDTWVVSQLDSFTTWVVDVRVWPPKVTTVPNFFARDAAISRDGRLAFLASTNKTERPRRFPLHVAESASKKPREFGELEQAQSVRFFGETPMLFSNTPGEGPWALEGAKLAKVRGLPRSTGYRNAIRMDEVGFDAGWFGDGTPLLVWDGSVYVKKGQRFSRLVKAKLRPETSSGTSTIPLGDDAALMLDDRKLVTVTKDGKLQRPFKKATNVMRLGNAGNGAVVLKQGDHPEGHAAKLWWPSLEKYLGIDAEELGVEEVQWVAWSPALERFVALADRKFIAFDESALTSREKLAK